MEIAISSKVCKKNLVLKDFINQNICNLQVLLESFEMVLVFDDNDEQDDDNEEFNEKVSFNEEDDDDDWILEFK